MARHNFYLGEFLVEPMLNRLTRGETSIRIEIRVMDVLLCLAEHHGELVARKTIIDSVWGTEFIASNTLNHAVALLRSALGDDARNPVFVETIHRRGYRLIAPVFPFSSGPDDPSKSEGPPGHHKSGQTTVGRNPYPGLAPFTEADTELFFGRQTEVALIWRSITARRLSVLFGPSGIGKTSLLRAGVISSAPKGWGVIYCQPGIHPIGALADAIPTEFRRFAAAKAGLAELSGSDSLATSLADWCDEYRNGIIVVDQFEELFTLNPANIRSEYASLLRRLADHVNVHVLLSVREDYLHRFHDHEDLKPFLSELIPIGNPHASKMKEAIIRPSARFGYTFEDERVVDEMLASLAGERGTLPLLSFALARLWEERDREKRLITREAYERMGGLKGALPAYAEHALQSIGYGDFPLAREIFRNLVTADGTRISRETKNLISAFDENQRESADRVLRRLIDGRLLTSFQEVNSDGKSGGHRVEIVHESLLFAWPRLLRWRYQDAGDEAFRDQLHRAARMWEDRNRPDDLLWTGTTYREFALWRVRSSDKLTELEKDFSRAMTAHSKRHRRRRRVVRTGVVAALLGILAGLGWTWKNTAIEARRVLAQELVLLADRERTRSARLAYALASLELADTPEAPLLAVRTLWQGPPARYIASQRDLEWAGRHVGRIDPMRQQEFRAPFGLGFSNDGNRLAAGHVDGTVTVWEKQGDLLIELTGHRGYVGTVKFGAQPGSLVTAGFDERVITWSLQTGEPRRVFEPGGLATFFHTLDGRNLITESGVRHDYETKWQAWPVGGGHAKFLGRMTSSQSVSWLIEGRSAMYHNGEWVVAHPSDRPLGIYSIDRLEGQPIKVLARNDRRTKTLEVSPDGRRIAACDEDDGIYVWEVSPAGESVFLRAIQGCASVHDLAFSPRGSQIVAVCDSESALAWDLDGPPEAEPIPYGHQGRAFQAAFHPSGRWLATTNWSEKGLALWPQNFSFTRVLKWHTSAITDLAFTPDGNHLVSSSRTGELRLWNLLPEPGAVSQILLSRSHRRGSSISSVAVARDGKSIAVAMLSGEVLIFGRDGTVLKSLQGIYDFVEGVVFDGQGRLLAVRGSFEPTNNDVTVWDLESGDLRRFDAGDGLAISDFEFTNDGRLLTSSVGGIREWALDTGASHVLRDDPSDQFTVDPAGRWLLSVTPEGVVRRDIRSGHEQVFSPVGVGVDVDATGEIAVVSCRDGSIRVYRANTREPYLLLGHEEGTLTRTAVSPDGRWIASGDVDGSIRLWLTPDPANPPLHTLSREELIAKLKSLTNLRAVRDPDSPTGWKVEVGPFPGWATVPEW